MVNTHVTTIRVEVSVECHLIPEVDTTTGRENLTIVSSDSQLPYWATAAVRDIRNSRWVVTQIFTHCVNAVVRILPATQQANSKNNLLAKLRRLSSDPCIHAF